MLTEAATPRELLQSLLRLSQVPKYPIYLFPPDDGAGPIFSNVRALANRSWSISVTIIVLSRINNYRISNDGSPTLFFNYRIAIFEIPGCASHDLRSTRHIFVHVRVSCRQ